MAEALSTDRLEELGIEVDPERLLIVNSLLGLCQQKLGISLKRITELISTFPEEADTDHEIVETTYARTVCVGMDYESHGSHVCINCSFSVLGGIAVNQTEIFLMYYPTGFAIGIDYLVAGSESPIASIEMNTLCTDWADEETALRAIYTDEVLISGGLIGDQPLDCVSKAANDATTLPFEVGY